MYHPFPRHRHISCTFCKRPHKNICGLAINVVVYVILFTAVVFELVRRHDVRADCTVFPMRLTSVWFRKEQIIVFCEPKCPVNFCLF